VKDILSKNIIVLNQVDELNSYFNEFVLIRGIAFIVLGFYKIGERDTEDIDIMVENKDKEKIFGSLKSLNYNFVPSGEFCFRRKFWELPIDVHFTKNLKFKEVGFSGKTYKVLDGRELFFEFLSHIYYQHYELREYWKKDFIRLREKIKFDVKELKKRKLLNAYNFVLKNLDNKNLKKTDFSGHFVFFFENSKFHEKWKYIFKKIFPDIEFIKRRYSLKNKFGVILFYLLRPFLLVKDFFIFLSQILLKMK